MSFTRVLHYAALAFSSGVYKTTLLCKSLVTVTKNADIMSLTNRTRALQLFLRGMSGRTKCLRHPDAQLPVVVPQVNEDLAEKDKLVSA